MPTFPARVMMKVPPAVLENCTTFPTVLDPMTVRTFPAAAGVEVDVINVPLTVPTVMFGIPVRFWASPEVRLVAVPVMPVPGPENCTEAVIVVPLIVFAPATTPNMDPAAKVVDTKDTAFMLRMFARLETFRVRTFPDAVAKDAVFRVRMFARLETFRVRTFPDVVAKDTVFKVRMFARLATFRVRMFARLETSRVRTFPDVVAKDTVFKVRMFARLETFRVWTFADAVPRLRMFEEVAFIVVA
jgi:hypothetical protein